MNEPSPFKPEHYNAVFEAMRKYFGENWYASVDWPRWGVRWRKIIKDWFFLKEILIQEMIDAIPHASKKQEWPIGTAFFQRLLDVVYLHRRERSRSVVKIERGPESIGSLLTKH